MPSEATPEWLSALETRHIAFLEARLVSDQAAAEWRRHVAAVGRNLLSARVGGVVDATALSDALERVLTSEAVERAARPVARRLLPLVLAELRADRGKIGDRVPAQARPRLEALVTREGSMPERLLREISEQDAIEEIMRDVLYDGFKEFAERVNPFTAEWGIPSLLKKMSVFGGAMSKGIETVKADFDRRLEPEIRRFLATFARRGLGRMVDVTVARADQPASVAVRRHVVAWVLEQEIAVLAREADEEALAIVNELALDIASAELDRAESRARWRALVANLLEGAKDQTIGEALASLGVTLEIDAEAIAVASWPLVKTVLGGPTVRAWLTELVHEFYESERARPPGQP